MSETVWVKSEFKRPTRRAMVWDEARNRYVKATDENGQPVIERLPQVGFIGNDLKNLKATPLKNRAIYVLTREGNILPVPLTESASVQVNDAQLAAALKRCNQLGRIRVGTCPIREVYSGLRASTLVAPTNRAADVKPCAESDLGNDDEGRPLAPCPHFLAEQKARLALQAAKNAEQHANHRDQAVKQLEAQAGQIEALGKVADSTAALVAHFVARDAAVAAPEPAPPAPAPTKDGGKK